MSKRRDKVTTARDEARVLAQELRQEHQEFLAHTKDFLPVDKATAWLAYIAGHQQSDSDVEALVYLASRSHDVARHVAELMADWKHAEREAIEQYNAGSSILNARTGHGARYERTAPATPGNLGTISQSALHNFWAGRKEEELTIDATILRCADWCQIGGFDHWWQRLASETTENMTQGCLDDVAGAYWLFAMCRSDDALKLMPQALRRCLETLTVPRTPYRLPWERKFDCSDPDFVNEESIFCASAIAFAEQRLQQATRLEATAIATVQRHFDKGNWRSWTCDSEPSIESTSMAIHALALTRPRGWEHMARQAAEWLLTVQDSVGCWAEDGSPGPVYLTVLVLDALNLAENRTSPLTFRLAPRAPTTTSGSAGDRVAAPGPENTGRTAQTVPEATGNVSRDIPMRQTDAPHSNSAKVAAKESRARTVAKLIQELNTLKPQMFEDDKEYNRLRDQCSDFLTFRIAETRPDLKMKILAIQGSARHVRLAQELAAAHHGKMLSTIQDDWKDYKPAEFRRQQ